MTDSLDEQLASYGIDYDDALDRFGGNVDLFKRLALGYLNDNRFNGLLAALEVGDYEEAYRQAHALKGVSGQLSLAELFEASSQVSNALKNGEVELARARLSKVEHAHKRAIAGLTAWKNDEL